MIFRLSFFTVVLASFASLATTFAPSNAQAESFEDFTPSLNRWSILVFASSDAEESPSFRNFSRLSTLLRSQNADAPETVVVFSPFEERPERRPSRETLDALLAWFRQNDAPAPTLALPAARATPDAPLEIRLFLCGRTQGNALRLPDSTQTLEIDAFRSALRESAAPCERTLFFFNLASDATTRRGSPAVLAPLAPPASDSPILNDAPSQEETNEFLESYYRTLFFNCRDSEFFDLLADAFAGDADGLKADGIVTALEILEHLRDVSPNAPATTRLGQDFPVAKTEKTPPAPPLALFLDAASKLRAQRQTLLADEATRRVGSLLAELEPSDFARLSFSQNERPSFESIRDGAFELSVRDARWLRLRLNGSDRVYFVTVESFAAAVRAARQRKSR